MGGQTISLFQKKKRKFPRKSATVEVSSERMRKKKHHLPATKGAADRGPSAAVLPLHRGGGKGLKRTKKEKIPFLNKKRHQITQTR